jgi:hypothetical protein
VVHLTSLTGDSVRIYPMPAGWPSNSASRAARYARRAKFLDRVNYFDKREFDVRGRARCSAAPTRMPPAAGDVDVRDSPNSGSLEPRSVPSKPSAGRH